MRICHWGIWLGIFLSLASCQDEKSKMIVCWGDSLTAPHAGGNWKGKLKHLLLGDDSYPAVLQTELGNDYNVVNAGIGGETTLTIMARQGAFPMKLAHDVIVYQNENQKYKKFVGNKDVAAFHSSYNDNVVTPLLQGGWDENSPARFNPCYIDGKEYTFKSESHFWREDGKYVFEYNYYLQPKEKPEKTYTLKAGSVIETYAMRHLRNAYANVFFMGQNGGFEDAADLIRQYKAMIEYSGSDNYIIVSFHVPNHRIPTIDRMKEMEDSLQQTFGNHYINLRDYMVVNGLKDAMLTPTEADADSIAKGKVPPQLIPDGCHFSSKGYELLGKQVYKRMKELNY